MAAGFRASASAGNGQSTTTNSLPIVVPSSAVAGDYAVLAVESANSAVTLTTPSGWTLLSTATAGSVNASWLLGKTLVSGDVGATVTLGFSSSVRCMARMVVGSGVTATGMTFGVVKETSSTTSPTLATLTGVASGSLVVVALCRRGVATVAAPGAFTADGSTQTAFGSSDITETTAWLVTTATGSVGGTAASSSPQTTGSNFLIALPASTTAGSGATVTGATATMSIAAPAGTVDGSGPPLVVVDTTYPPAPYREALRAGGFDVTYSIKASLGGVPVQGAQDLRPTGGTITDTTKPGVRRLLSLELAPEVINGVRLDDLLTPSGTTLTVTAHIKYLDQSTFDLPMGVFDVDSESVTEGGGKLSLTAPDKWVRVQRARFLVPQSSTPGIAVTAQITQLIQGALGGGEQVVVTATSTATVGALTWDRDRDKAIIDLATSIGAWVFFDRNGVATVADIPQIGVSADWLIDASASGVLVSMDRQQSRQGTYNVVGVTSSASGGEAFPPVYVWDGDPNSPTYAGTDPVSNPGSAGPFGIVPIFYSSPVLSSTGEAQAAGLSILSRTIGLSRQVSLSQVWNPAMDAFAVIDVLGPPIQFGPSRELERHVADTVTHPLVKSGSTPQQIDGRSTRTDYTADVSG